MTRALIEFDLLFQRPADRRTIPPSIWFLTPSGFMTRPASTADQTRRTRISSSTSTWAITRDVCGRVLVSSETDAAGAARATFGAAIPSGLARNSLKDSAGS